MLASVGTLEISLAIALVAMAVAFAWLIVLVNRQQIQKLPRVALPALAIIIVAIVVSMWNMLPGPREFAPLTTDIAILIDTSRSMAIEDDYHDVAMREHVKILVEPMCHRLEWDLPGHVALLSAEPDEVTTRERLAYWQKQKERIAANTWKPSRLHVAQALLTRNDPNWLRSLLQEHQARTHIYHLDIEGRPVKLRDPNGDAGELADPEHESGMQRAANAISLLEPLAKESPLGAAIRSVIDSHRRPPLSQLILFTDGLTTDEDSLTKAAAYAAEMNVALRIVGLGETPRDLWLHDLHVETNVDVGRRVNFEARVSGIGFGDIEVPVVLKRKERGGDEEEINRQTIKLNPDGREVSVRFFDEPKVAGVCDYIVEVTPPPMRPEEKLIPPNNLRIERTVDVSEGKPIKVLYVESQPRFEFRFLKFLMDRERLAKAPAVDLNVLLLDADRDWERPVAVVEDGQKPIRKEKLAPVPPVVLQDFPRTLEGPNAYDVIIIGDCDPKDPKLAHHLQNIAHSVRGEDVNGKPTERGCGILFIAGASNNPHRFKNTPLAELLPVVPRNDQPPREVQFVDTYRLALTAAGREHPMFRFRRDPVENQKLLKSLHPIFWCSSDYQARPNAEWLAVHPSQMAAEKSRDGEARHPLILHMPVGAGRSMFFGIDETWRWRRGEHESNYASFWMRTLRFLARRTNHRTTLSLDQRTPYRQGETINVTVTLADELYPVLAKSPVNAVATFMPVGRMNLEFIPIPLKRSQDRSSTYYGVVKNARPGQYRIRLTEPDLVALNVSKSAPTAIAVVEPLPGELDRVPINVKEMVNAATVTKGAYFAVADADKLLSEPIRR